MEGFLGIYHVVPMTRNVKSLTTRPLMEQSTSSAHVTKNPNRNQLLTLPNKKIVLGNKWPVNLDRINAVMGLVVNDYRGVTFA